MKVHVINPKRRKRSGPTSRKRAPVAKKKARKRRAPARRAPAPKRRAPARRRRNTNPAPRRRSTRRRNPSIGGGITREFQRFMPRLAGKLWVAWVVRRWGALGGAGGQLLGGGATQSWTAGSSWTLGQYILAGVAIHFGSKIFGRVMPAEQFREGGWDLILTKLVWTEGISRSDWAKAQFGSPRVAYSPGSGQAWMEQGGQWSALQGEERIVEASPLDGTRIREASALDGMGHLLPPDVSASVAKQGRYSGSGYVNNYQAAYAS